MTLLATSQSLQNALEDREREGKNADRIEGQDKRDSSFYFNKYNCCCF